MRSSIRRFRPLLTAAGLFALLTAGSTAWGQETVYIGGSSASRSPVARGDVRVDMSVLDDLNRGGASAAPGPRVTLTPPSQKKAATQHKSTAKPKPATTRKATAAKPVAPKSSAPAATAKAAAPTPVPTPISTAPAQAAPQPAPQARTASNDLPPPPPEPIEITMPPAAAPVAPAAPKAVASVAAPATAAVAAAKSSDPAKPAASTTKPTPTPAPAPAVAAKEPAVRMAEPTPAPAPEPSPNPRAAAAAEAPAVAAATVAPKPAPAAPTQTAALVPAPQSASTGSKQSLRIPFSGEAATLPEPSKSDLKDVAGALSKDPALRVQVMAYASGNDDASKARRLSLSRALAVRSYLIEQGIGSTRIDVRALGNATEGGPSDRVDLMVMSR